MLFNTLHRLQAVSLLHYYTSTVNLEGAGKADALLRISQSGQDPPVVRALARELLLTSSNEGVRAMSPLEYLNRFEDVGASSAAGNTMSPSTHTVNGVDETTLTLLEEEEVITTHLGAVAHDVLRPSLQSELENAAQRPRLPKKQVELMALLHQCGVDNVDIDVVALASCNPLIASEFVVVSGEDRRRALLWTLAEGGVGVSVSVLSCWATVVDRTPMGEGGDADTYALPLAMFISNVIQKQSIREARMAKMFAVFVDKVLDKYAAAIELAGVDVVEAWCMEWSRQQACADLYRKLAARR